MIGSGRAIVLGALLVGVVASTSAAQLAMYRLDCGGPGGPAPSGPAFTADAPFTVANGAGWVGGHSGPISNFDADNGPSDDAYHLNHCTGNAGWGAYRFNLAAGSYVLRLHFMEIDEVVHGPGQRLFSLTVEGQPLLTDLDLAAQLGIRYAGEFVVPVTVSDGRLDLEKVVGPDPALLNAVEVWRVPATPPTPGPVTGLLVKNGYGRNILAWNPTLDPFVTGFLVERAPSAAGPWTPLPALWTAPPRCLDAAAPPGVPSFYRVRALGLGGATGPVSAVLAATALPQSAAVPRVFELSVAPEDILFLDEHLLTDPDEEVPGTFTSGGQTWNVQVRYRGDGTLLLSKKSWKVKFPTQEPFEGRTELNLKAHFLDPALERERLCGDLFADLRHPVSGQQLVHLVVNGVHRGVFTDFEQVDQPYLLSRGRDPGGSIYKADVMGAALQILPTPADYAIYYEKKTNEAAGNADLVDFVELLNDPATTPAQLADAFDVDDYLDYLAVVGWTGCGDQIGHNYYLLHDLALQRWEWITWDNDRSFYLVDMPIDVGTSTCASCNDINVLKDRVLADPGFRWRYAEKVRALMEGAAAPAAFAAAVAARHAQVHDDALADVAKQGWEHDDAFLAGPAELLQFADERGAFVLAALAGYEPPQPPTSLWLNELLAFSESDLAGGGAGTGGAGVGPGALHDEAGDADDWLELFNASAAPLDAGGLFLTNDLADPARWALPPGTQVPPGGRLLVWCDGETNEGPLHAGFSLDPAGGELALFAADGATLLDVFHWRPQQPGVAEGRVPDGGAIWRALPQPTPLAANAVLGNAPPVITWASTDPSVPATLQPVQASVQAKDPDAPLVVTLHWRVDGGAFAEAAMQPAGNDLWTAALPAEPSGTHVEWYAEAVDALGAVARLPAAAPSVLFGYVVADHAAGAVRLNEFMADNASTLTDDHGEFEDWVELYNPGTQSADVSGFHLTDTFAQPLQWTFPPGTTIAPHGHLLVWTDGEPAEGPLHASFKLSKSGEALGLFDAEGVWVDGFSFGLQATDVSQGLLPDGADVPGESALVSWLDPSPSAANVPAPGASRRYDAVLPSQTAVVLQAVSPPQLGGTLSFSVTSAAPNAQGLIFPSLQPLQLGLGAEGVLLALPMLELGLSLGTDGAGAAQAAFHLPGKAALAGLPVEWQAWVLGSGLSNAVITTLGP